MAVVFSEGRTASTDYFLFPYLEHQGYQTTLVDSRVVPSGRFPVDGCRLVVISRYLPRRWLRIVEGLCRQGVNVIYFMDDDLFDPKRWQAYRGGTDGKLLTVHMFTAGAS